MLTHLSIQNFALIDEIELEFESGLNVLTGETGAGKSILIDALRLVLGGRMEADQVRDKNLPCSVEAVFSIAGSPLPRHTNFAEFLKPGDENLILKREITPEGRSKSLINRRSVNLSELREIGTFLIDIHGQHDLERIFEPASHFQFVDRLAGTAGEGKAGSLLRSYQKHFARYAELIRKKEAIARDRQTTERQIDLLNYQIDEIQKVSPKEGEDQTLLEERIRLAHSEKLSEIVSRILGKLSEEEDAASGKIGGTFRDFSEFMRIDASTAPLQKEAESVQAGLEELVRSLTDYRENLSFDPERLTGIDERLDQLEKIKRKYGGSLREALAFLEQAKKSRDHVVNADVYEKEVEDELKRCLPELKKEADELTQLRRKAGQELAKQVEKELKDLAVRDAKFETRIEKRDFGPEGQDHVEFFLSPNPGEPVKPLIEIASGGEASRMLLAIKRSLAEVDAIPTLIFDEIDASIGGRLGAIVGEKLKEMSGERQVLLITHLPQIASFADRHFKVRKWAEKGKTRIEYKILKGEERVKELAQMMSGEKETKISKAHAEEMLKVASK